MLKIFDGSDLGPVSLYFGDVIEKNDSSKFLSKSAYIVELLVEYDVLNDRKFKTSMTSNWFDEIDANKDMYIL